MTEPQIICPKCSTEIKLTESLAAPLIAETRKQFDAQLAQKEADFGRREAQLRKSQEALAKSREAIDEEVAKKLRRLQSEPVAADAGLKTNLPARECTPLVAATGDIACVVRLVSCEQSSRTLLPSSQLA